MLYSNSHGIVLFVILCSYSSHARYTCLPLVQYYAANSCISNQMYFESRSQSQINHAIYICILFSFLCYVY